MQPGHRHHAQPGTRADIVASPLRERLPHLLRQITGRGESICIHAAILPRRQHTLHILRRAHTLLLTRIRRILLRLHLAGGGGHIAGEHSVTRPRILVSLHIHRLKLCTLEKTGSLMPNLRQHILNILAYVPALTPCLVNLCQGHNRSRILQRTHVPLHQVLHPGRQRQSIRIHHHIRTGQLTHALRNLSLQRGGIQAVMAIIKIQLETQLLHRLLGIAQQRMPGAELRRVFSGHLLLGMLNHILQHFARLHLTTRSQQQRVGLSCAGSRGNIQYAGGIRALLAARLPGRSQTLLERTLQLQPMPQRHVTAQRFKRRG